MVAAGCSRAPRVLEVLKGIDLELRRGETLGLVGESGCGKSTLARVIAGLIPMTGGRVTMLGQDIATLEPAAWRAMRRQVQLVFQNPFGAAQSAPPGRRHHRRPLPHPRRGRGRQIASARCGA